MEEYLKLMKVTKEKVLCYAAAQDWLVVKKSNGVVITTHQEVGIPAKIFKAECEVELSPADLFNYVAITDSAALTSRKGQLQKSVKSWEILQELGQNMFIVRSVSYGAAGGIISPREYLDLVFNFIDPEEGSFLSCATGIDIPYPEDSKYIRGRNYPSGILCLPIPGEPTKTRVVYIIHTYLGGHIPSKVVDMVLPSMQVTYFSNLHKAVKENRTQPTSDMAGKGKSTKPMKDERTLPTPTT